MKKIFFFLVMLLTVCAYSQNVYETTLADGDSITNPIKLDYNEIPAGIFADSLTTSSLVGLYCWFGDTTGTTVDDWYRVSSTNGTWYSLTLDEKLYISFDATKLFSLVSNPYLYADKKSQVWLWFVLRTTQTDDKIIKLRTRYY